MKLELHSPYDDSRHWWDRINRKLFPWIGPPPLGPYDQPPQQPAAEQACPLCGKAMSLHQIDRSAPRTQLYCPEG